jgi:hypothetical protein
MTSEYIDERNSVVYSFLRGNSPDGVHEEYPLLSRPQIRRAITFYPEHREAVDCYLENKQREFEASTVPLSEQIQSCGPDLASRL